VSGERANWPIDYTTTVGDVAAPDTDFDFCDVWELFIVLDETPPAANLNVPGGAVFIGGRR